MTQYMEVRSKVLFLVLFLSAQFSLAETRIQILHTSDIHGHFINSDSPQKLGGMARLKYKVNQLRKMNQHSLMLDSGDWSEGTLFYTLNSGEANHRMMESFNYDAIVLGNHEWLAGPRELYQGFFQADFKIPILGANVRTDKSPADAPLDRYIKPYIIKEIGGVRVGILGLSTFDLIYDPFFDPIELEDPIRVASRYVKELREKHGCGVVILLTHTGIHMDKNLAQSIPGIDLILGGHTHLLTPKPIYVNGVPIVHVGAWAHYLGEYELVYDAGRVRLSSHKLHQIDERLPEDIDTKVLIEGFENRLIEKFGNIFSDKIFQSDIYLPLDENLTENVLANWSVDAIRSVGRTDLALDVGQYYRRGLFAGESSSVDIFNMFPHVYSSEKEKSWTIQTFEVRGSTIQHLVNVFSKLNYGVRVSGGKYQLDLNSTFSGVQKFDIQGKRLRSTEFYKVSATKGVLVGLEYLKILGLDVGVRGVRDTGVEAWKAIREALRKKTPVTPLKAKWEGRVRTLQPDIHIPVEQIYFQRNRDQILINFSLLNAGLTSLNLPRISLKVDRTPEDSLDEKWIQVDFPSLYGQSLKPGRGVEMVYPLDISDWEPGLYSVDIESLPVPGESNTDNNSARSYFTL